MMGKIALLAIVVVVALLWFRYKAAAAIRAERKTESGAPRVESMVQCAACGVHLPSGEAVVDGSGVAYCSAAHRLAGRRRT